MKTQKINLFGASGHAKVIIDIIESMSGFEVGYIFDDNPEIKSLNDYKVYSSKEIELLSKYPICFTIGNNEIRKKLSRKVEMMIAPPLIHETAFVSKSVSIGEGTVIMPSAVVNASTKIGRHCIINTSSIIEHDVVIEDYVHVSPNATITGGITIGEGTHVGASATIIPNLKIGEWCTLGAGTVVIKSVSSNSKVVGNPSRSL